MQDGLEKVADGLTTFEELLKIIELDDDDKIAGDFDLQTALKYTSLTHETNAEVEKKKQHEHKKAKQIAEVEEPNTLFEENHE